MTKRSIAVVSLIVIIVTLIALLFGVVFCLKNQSVKVVDGTPLLIDKSEIINTAGLKKGKSIFLIDKEKATNNIERAFPHIKVVQIKTIGLRSIQICVRTRHEMYYIEANEKYYVLDEDFKVLNIIEEVSLESEPTNLTKISTGDVSIPESAELCDFVGTEHQKSVAYYLFVAMNTVVTKMEGENEVYLTRDDIREIVKTINFENHESYNKLIIETSHGVVLDIENPESNMQNKINICFSTIEQFIAEESDKEKSGTIKIYYDLNHEMKCVYIPHVEESE